MGLSARAKRYAGAKKRRQALARAKAKKLAEAKARRMVAAMEERKVCPHCLVACGVREEHPDCVVATEIKAAANSLADILRGAEIFLTEAREKLKRMMYAHSPRKIREAGLLFYESLVGAYNKGALEVVSVGIIQPFIDGLARLAKLLRKTEVFQGNRCLTP